MEYYIQNGNIIIPNPVDFNIKHICECGQMFRYEDKGTYYVVISTDLEAIVHKNDNKSVVIESKNPNYYANYFDLNNDYAIIKAELIKTPILKLAVDYGYGIRIAKQNLLETLISFIISANNNITRIKKIIENICANYGKNMGGYFAFPTLEALKAISVQEFAKFGAGYRAEYLHSTIKQLNQNYLYELSNQTTQQAYKTLLSLKGVGNKVAECILLFGLNKVDVFPVDVWMDRVCEEYFDLHIARNKKSEAMVKRFGSLAGYAQQYLFYYKRNLRRT